MRRALLIVAMAALIPACEQSTPVAHVSAIPSVSTSPAICAPAPSYGLLIAGGQLELVSTAGCIRASVPITPSSALYCSKSLPGYSNLALVARLKTPVSASNTKVYFRDGDSRIRSLDPDGQVGEVTTVPGSDTVESMFEVSPDDKRIAVVVEDMTAPSSITERIYVEDLVGHRHHVEIFHATTPKNNDSIGRWPVGWVGDRLVLVLTWMCFSADAGSPTAPWETQAFNLHFTGWRIHVVDASSGRRVASIPGQEIGCLVGLWPSFAGVAEACPPDTGDPIYDWNGTVTWRGKFGIGGLGGYSGNLSPNGNSVFVPSLTADEVTNPPFKPKIWLYVPVTYAFDWETTDPSSGLGYRVHMFELGDSGCLWIDDQSILAPGAVIDYPSGTAHRLAIPGVCAGRFPDSL